MTPHHSPAAGWAQRPEFRKCIAGAASALALASPLWWTPAGALGQGDAAEVPAPVKMGQRVKSLKQKVRVRPILVLVRNETEFADAVSLWKLPEDCFPVLIDDGSDAARENIARFVHAFRGRAIVRWNGDPGAEAWPADPAARAERISRVQWKAWNAEDDAGMKGQWGQVGHTCIGLTLASPTDPAWTAALTLATMRGQRLVWLDAASSGGGQPGDTMSGTQLMSLITATEEAAKASEQSWERTGDDLEAITLCTNSPSKIRAVGGGGIEQVMALTDRLGRNPDNSRWAYGGQVFGDAAAAAYRAMSSVFLGIDKAWAFDGYAVGSVPGLYNLKPIIYVLANTPVRLAFDPARSSAEDFRGSTRGGIDAGLVYVNTKGQMWNFEFSPGKLYSFDVPLLRRPSLVHFTHSYSAQVVHHRSSVAGRWLDNGACCYFGSIDEPYLSSFVPGPEFFARFCLMGGTISSCARFESAPLGKLNLYGDPLIISGAPPLRLDGVLPEEGPLAGLTPLEDQLGATLKNGKIEQAAADLVILGRDKDAVRLCMAGVKKAFSESAAGGKPTIDAGRLGAIGVPAAFRERDPESLASLFLAMPNDLRNDPFYASVIWQGLRPSLSGDVSVEAVAALKGTIRELTALEDLKDISAAVRKLEGRSGVEGMWKMVIARTTDPSSRAALEEGLREVLRR